MSLSFHVIKGQEVSKILEDNSWRIQEIIKQAYLLHHQQKTINPNSYFLRYPDKKNSRIIALPAHIGGEINVSGIKWIASNPDNIKRGLQRASAVLILNDAETGYPFACLESSIISAVRTASSAVLAAEYLRKKDKSDVKLGIVGAGYISRNIYQAFKRNNWDLAKVSIFDLNHGYADCLKDYLQSEGHNNISLCESVDELVINSDLVVFATSATLPSVFNRHLFDHNPIVLNISLRDLSADILLHAHNVVDDIEHVLSANTSPHIAEQTVGHRNFINGTIAGYIQGEYQLDQTKPIIFSPMGMGILDLALGKFVYDEAVRNNNFTEIKNFFAC